MAKGNAQGTLRVENLEGIVLHSRDFGYCKVTSQLDQRLRIRFCGSDREAWYTVATVAQQRDFKWLPLPVGLKCRVEGRGECTISATSFGADETSRVHEYSVEFDGDARETARISERDLWPIPGSLTETPLTRASSLSVDSHAHFLAREGLLAAITQLHRETSGIQALAASRIDLLPHQAFVAGTVIDDPVWRYVLADEVGLGKTVEAGVIAHQLLASRPAARVLVLCPGPLARQWLCEMHLSFGGRDFHLVDLHRPGDVRWAQWTRIIASLKVAIRDHRRSILGTRWDLVIVDEAHHLLWNEDQYEFVRKVSEGAGGLLLLSAVPAREREQELLRLLQLIDPRRYAVGTPVAEKFVDLYGAQEVIGRRVRILSRYVEDSQDADFDLLQSAASRLMDSPIVREDADLLQTFQKAKNTPDSATATEQYRRLRDDVVARYRISRRILKNRRARLVDNDLMAAVERRCEVVYYTPRPIEAEVASCLQDIVRLLANSPISRTILHAFFRKALPALCDPVASYEVATALQTFVEPTDGNETSTDIDGGVVLDYEEHEGLLDALAASLGPHLERPLVERLATLLRAWIDDSSQQPRVEALLRTIDRLRDSGSEKIVVFAGTYGTAEFLVEELTKSYGLPAVASFRHDLDDDKKEREVTRFRREFGCCILVSDESGGEGRNFQFAQAVVHFDLPWSVAAIEQRIGRLDRIGRREPVHSVVLCAVDSVEGAWVECLEDGFEVFRRSISGLEFMLRHTERTVIDGAIAAGSNGIAALAAQVKADSDKERASDDADALTDAASFNGSQRYLRAIDASADSRLEESFPRYFRAISHSGSAKRVTDLKDLNLKTWRLKPEDIADIRLPGFERGGDSPLQERYGTFLRSVARDRPDLEFFSTGHRLFDAICAVARQHVRGRTYAVRITSNDIQPGQYLAVVVNIVPGRPDEPEAALARAERHLVGRRIKCLYDLAAGSPVSGADVMRVFDQHLVLDGSANDIPKDKLVGLMQPFLDDWGVRLKRALEVVEDQVSREQRDQFGAVDDAFQGLLAEERVEVKRSLADEASTMDASLRACAQAVRRAGRQIDSLGIVHVVEGVA